MALVEQRSCPNRRFWSDQRSEYRVLHHQRDSWFDPRIHDSDGDSRGRCFDRRHAGYTFDPSRRDSTNHSDRHVYGWNDPRHYQRSGELTPVTTSGNAYYAGYGYNGQGQNNYGLAVHPSGNFLYAAQVNSSQIAAYWIDARNGGLSLAGTYTTGSNMYPYSVALDPTGKFLYAGNSSSSTISGYVVNGTNGALTAISGAPFTTLPNPYALTVDASGKHRYVAASSGLAGYTIDSTSGALTAISGSPFTIDCCFNLESVAVDRTGRFLYAANYSSGTVYAYGIDQASGGLTAITGSPFGVGSNPCHLAIDASSRFIYVTLYGNPGSVVALAINHTSGALTPVTGSPFTGGYFPNSITTTGAVAASSATLQSVQISPASGTITNNNPAGQTLQFLLLGQYSNGTTKSLTESATWSSSNSSVATIGSTPGVNGQCSSTVRDRIKSRALPVPVTSRI